MKTAVVLGGTHDHIKLVNLLKAGGYYTILIDYLQNPPARRVADEHIVESALDKKIVLAIARRRKADIVRAICIDQALPVMAYVSEKLNLPCHLSYEQSLDITNKFRMKKKLVDCDIKTSKYIIIDQNNKHNFDELTFPIVIKPVDSNGSKGVYRVNKKEDFKYYYSKSISYSASGQIIVEEYIEGIEYSADLWIHENKTEVIMISKNIKRGQENDFTITHNLFKKEYLMKYSQQIESIANRIVKNFGLNNGPMLLQLIKKEEDFFVLEFSARIGGGSKHHFIKKMTGLDPLHNFICGWKAFNKRDNSIRMNYGAMKYLYSKKGIVGGTHNLEELKSKKYIHDYFIYKEKGSEISGNKFSSNRIAGLMFGCNDINDLNINFSRVNNQVFISDENKNNILFKNDNLIIE